MHSQDLVGSKNHISFIQSMVEHNKFSFAYDYENENTFSLKTIILHTFS